MTAGANRGLGGWLVDVVGWRAIFYLNFPVAAAAIVIVLRYVEESAEEEGALDWRGATLATAALGALTLWSTSHVTNAPIWIGLGAGLALLALFAWTEWRLGDRAMMPLALFASRPFVGLTVMTLLLYGALGGLILLAGLLALQ